MLNNLEVRNKMQINIHEQITKEENFFIYNTWTSYTGDFLELVNPLTMNFYFLQSKIVWQ